MTSPVKVGHTYRVEAPPTQGGSSPPAPLPWPGIVQLQVLPSTRPPPPKTDTFPGTPPLTPTPTTPGDSSPGLHLPYVHWASPFSSPFCGATTFLHSPAHWGGPGVFKHPSHSVTSFLCLFFFLFVLFFYIYLQMRLCFAGTEKSIN